MKRKSKLRVSKASIPLCSVRKLAPYALVTVMLSIGIIYLKKVQFKTILPIKQVVVEGKLKHLNQALIKTLVLNNIGGGYFTLNLMRVRKRLLKNAWIKNISIRRQWPARLIVNVKEKVAVSYWNKHAFISAEGKVFRPVNMDTTLLLPHMFGPPGQQKKVWMFMNKIYSPLASLLLRVDVLSLDKRRAWKLVLSYLAEKKLMIAGKQANNTLTIRLGRYDTDIRFKRFINVFSRINSPNLSQIKAIDMRYPNGFAVLKKKLINRKDKVAANDFQNIFPGNNLNNKMENRPEEFCLRSLLMVSYSLLPSINTPKEV